MLMKSKERFDHPRHLQGYDMKLNPLKCTFEVSSSKFLGFMVTWRGIDAHPTQLKPIMDSRFLIFRKGVQQLTSRIVALEGFISLFTDRLKPFFITLRGAKRVGWKEECDQAFTAIKQYLIEPPILASPEMGHTLYLYLAVSKALVSVDLFKENENRKQRPIFFMSKYQSEA